MSGISFKYLQQLKYMSLTKINNWQLNCNPQWSHVLLNGTAQNSSLPINFLQLSLKNPAKFRLNNWMKFKVYVGTLLYRKARSTVFLLGKNMGKVDKSFFTILLLYQKIIGSIKIDQDMNMNVLWSTVSLS